PGTALNIGTPAEPTADRAIGDRGRRCELQNVALRRRSPRFPRRTQARSSTTGARYKARRDERRPRPAWPYLTIPEPEVESLGLRMTAGKPEQSERMFGDGVNQLAGYFAINAL